MSSRGRRPIYQQTRAQSGGEQDQNESKPSPNGINPYNKPKKRSPTEARLIVGMRLSPASTPQAHPSLVGTFNAKEDDVGVYT